MKLNMEPIGQRISSPIILRQGLNCGLNHQKMTFKITQQISSTTPMTPGC